MPPHLVLLIEYSTEYSNEVPTVSYPSLFLFRLDGACFFQPNNLKCTGENKFSYSK